MVAVVVALLGATLGVGCHEQKAPQTAAKTAPTADGAPCFADDGPVAFLVDGVPVPEKAVLRLAAFLRAREPSLTLEQAKEIAVTRYAFPVAAIYAAGLKPKADGSSAPTVDAGRRATKIAEALRGGADFKTLAEESDDVATRSAGGEVGSVTRAQIDQGTLAEAAFALPSGGVAGPVFSIYGAHVLRVTEIADGASPQQDRRKIAHVLAAYDPETYRSDLAGYRRHAQEIIEHAKATVVIESYKKLIPLSARN